MRYVPACRLFGSRVLAAAPPLAVVALLAAAPAPAQIWTPIGPVETSVSSLDGHPDAGGPLLAAVDGAVYRSQDGGASWTPVLSGDIREVAVSPADPLQAYALANRDQVYRSEDGGSTWEPSLSLGADHYLFDLWTDPVDPGVAYFSSLWSILFTEDPTSLYRTADGGLTWESVWLGALIVVRDVGFGTGFERSHLASLPGLLLRSADGGLSWALIDAEGLDGGTLGDIAGDPATSGRFLASPLDGGLLESIDEGNSWHSYGVGLPGGSFLRLRFDPVRPGIVYAASQGAGVYRSVDGGATWAPIGTGSPADRLDGELDLALTGDPLELFTATDQGVQVADPATVPPCAAGPATLCLQGGRFEARAAWQDFHGGAGEGRALPLTGDTGAFWFFRDTNLELAVKVLDGTPVNGFFWNFFGSLSNVPFTLTMRDSVTGDQRFYVNPPRTFASQGDTRGFPQNPAPVGGSRHAGGPAALGGDLGTVGFGTGIGSIGAAGGTGGDCVPSDTALCLQDGRFRVEVEWRDFEGGSGFGHGHPLTGDTGAFWFFDDTNLELFVKVLDGTPVNGHFWVFFGSLSNVSFTLTVTDTVTGEPRVYENPERVFASQGDTAAF